MKIAFVSHDVISSREATMGAKRILTGLAAAAIAAGVAGTALAVPALDFTGGTAGGVFATTADFTVGWVFDVTGSVDVDGLGVWDEGANGLSEGHEVSLWTIAGSLVATATVTGASTATASGSSDGQWLFQDIGPLTLTAGRYVLGAAYTSNDDFIRTGAVLSTQPGIDYVEGTTAAGGPVFPNRFKGDIGGYLGPNLRIAEDSETTNLPEPAGAALFGLALAGLGIARHRKGR
jgi:hypothetical protein